MNTPTHPSPEFLSAYTDAELSPSEMSSLDTHLEQCPECRAELSSFQTLNDLGKELPVTLPGESYWADLPDRILVRARREEVPVADPGRSWWERLWNPQGTWRYAIGASVSLALVAGLWLVLSKRPNIWNAPGQGVPTAEVVPPAPEPVDLAPDADAPSVFVQVARTLEEEPKAPPMSPRSFLNRVNSQVNDRVLVTLDPRNVGTSLDIQSGRAAEPRMTGGSPAGVQVSNTLPGLAPRTINEAQELVSAGCGEDPIEYAFLAALKAEESGDYRLAAQGYQLIRASVPRGQFLRHEAEYRLVRLLWESQMTPDAAYTQRAQAMAQLHSMANEYFRSWQESNRPQDCQKAWCLNKVLMTLGPEVGTPSRLEDTSTRLNQLKNCVE